MNTEKLTLPTKPQSHDDSTLIAEITISLHRIQKLAESVANDERLYLIRYEADAGLNAARALSEPAVVS